MTEAKSPGSALAVKRDRLPSLQEVLSRRSAAPLDLYCYYLFLQREGAEDTLDFWLDVQQHENLCRAYFKDLRKSGRSVKEDWPQYYDVARRRGSIFNSVNGIQRERLSAFDKEALEADLEDSRPKNQSLGPSLNDALSSFDEHEKSPRGFGSLGVDEQRTGRTPSPTSGGYNPAELNRALSPTLRALYPDQHSPSDQDHRATTGRRSLGSRLSSKLPVQPFIKRDAAITRTDLIASAELIYSRYLLQGADKEIYLPPALRVDSFPLSSAHLPNVQNPQYDVETEALARVPDMFHQQKEYVYRQMEQDTFPRFLRAKSFGNLTPLSSILRLSFGLLALWAGLSTALALIFLDSKPKTRRLWIILPFSIAILFILSHSYDLDPILVFFGRTETTPFRTLKIREPYVRKLLVGRAIWVTFLTILIVAILTLIFSLVPGHRL